MFVWLVFLSIVRFDLIKCTYDHQTSLIFSDCKHLILPVRCQCYHSGDESQLRCQNIQLDILPKLPNNMRWFALDFSHNNLSSIDSYVFSDIYVEQLNFKYNHLRTIDVTAFDQIQNLKQLLIDHNQLIEFHPNTLIDPGIDLGSSTRLETTDNIVVVFLSILFKKSSIFRSIR
jgi:hypothetical protein